MNSLQEINLLSIAVRMLLAVVIGGVLGFERELHNRPAGFRTYMLVCVGSTLVMMTNQYVYINFDTGDLVRMGAQVVSGIGFLGAGTILVTGKNRVRGITTAAGLWTAASCGLALGIGFYEGALIGCLLCFIIVAIMPRFDKAIRANSHYLEVYLELDPSQPFSAFIEYSKKNNVEVHEIQVQRGSEADGRFSSVILLLYNRDKKPPGRLMQILAEAPGVSYFEELR